MLISSDLGDLVDRSSGGIGEVPVDVFLAGDVRALVATAHRDHEVGLLGEVAREQLRLSVGEVDADLVHRLEHLRVHLVGRCRPRRTRAVSALRGAVNSAWLICERPAFCRQTNRAVLMMLAGRRPRPARWWGRC